jgi:hypothetical protein
LKGRAANAHQQIEKHMAELRTFQGAIDDIDYVNNTYCPVAFENGLSAEKPDVPVEAPKLLIELAPEMLAIINDV